MTAEISDFRFARLLKVLDLWIFVQYPVHCTRYASHVEAQHGITRRRVMMAYIISRCSRASLDGEDVRTEIQLGRRTTALQSRFPS